VIPSAILGRYARSLAEVVFEQNLEQIVTEDLRTYHEIFRVVPDLLEVFHSPGVPREAKVKLLDDLMVLHPANLITSNFLRILLQHNRIRYFHQIYESYLASVNDHKGIVSAKISTATPLALPELQNLRERLAGLTGKIVNIEPQTNPALLGGIVVQIGDTIFDGSIQAQLSEMRRRLAET
jgi:F-type H+-transporting ATPase subunit delta